MDVISRTCECKQEGIFLIYFMHVQELIFLTNFVDVGEFFNIFKYFDTSLTCPHGTHCPLLCPHGSLQWLLTLKCHH
jgi:hypothetical protein